MLPIIKIGLAACLALATQSATQGWQFVPAEGGPMVLTYAAGSPVSYRFECAANEVIVTETGVTKLLNLGTGKQIGDDAGAVMPAGSAMMAVFAGKGEPKFQPAAAVKNPAGGWDLTIRLPRDDKQLKAVGKAEMMSLFTTGFTMAVVMEASDRSIWNDFMTRCNAA